ncbi:MAG: DUF3106 domain-containing protein [Aquabacterium sp.]
MPTGILDSPHSCAGPMTADERRTPLSRWCQPAAWILALLGVAASAQPLPEAPRPGPIASTAAALPGTNMAPAQTQVRPKFKPAGPDATDWSRLSATQKTALSALQAQWSGLDVAQRRKWLDVAARMPTMTVEEQQRLRDRMRDWSALTPIERGQARLSFQQAQQLAPSERQAQWSAYQALSSGEREALTQSGAASAAAGVRPPVAARPTTVAAPPAPVKPVSPTIVQVKPGATTTLMNNPGRPLTQRGPDAPRIAATAQTVDSSTLLPKRGPQGAPMRAAAASAPAAQP